MSIENLLETINIIFNRKLSIKKLLNMYTIIDKKEYKRDDMLKAIEDIKDFNTLPHNLLWNKSKESYKKILEKKPNLPIEFYRISGNINNMKSLLDSAIQTNVLDKNVTFVKKYYNYIQNDPNIDNWFVDFANEKLGGHVFTGAFVQEEKMCYIFPELMALANKSIYIDEPKNIQYKNRTGAILIKRLLLSLKSGGTDKMDGFYGSIKQECIENNTIKDECATSYDDILYTHIIAIDALQLSNIKDLYDYNKETLITYFTKTYNGFRCAKDLRENSNMRTIINTGEWGAGVFGNKKEVMFAIQILAAIAADVEIIIHSKSNDVQNTPEYKSKILQIMKDICSYLST